VRWEDVEDAPADGEFTRRAHRRLATVAEADEAADDLLQVGILAAPKGDRPLADEDRRQGGPEERCWGRNDQSTPGSEEIEGGETPARDLVARRHGVEGKRVARREEGDLRLARPGEDVGVEALGVAADEDHGASRCPAQPPGEKADGPPGDAGDGPPRRLGQAAEGLGAAEPGAEIADRGRVGRWSWWRSPHRGHGSTVVEIGDHRMTMERRALKPHW
jgi:hypothetical protein